MPTVSIITTTLNRVRYLREAIQSALAQTLSDFELLVCDDGGSAETRDLCASFKDPRIRHIVNGTRLGLAMNAFSGVMQANSDLIAFLNDDDRWTERFLEHCVAPILSSPNVVLAFSDHWLIDADGHRLPRDTEKNTRLYRRDTLPAGPINAPQELLAANSIPLAMASVFRKSAVDWKMYSPKVEGSYDYFLSYCLIRSGGGVVYVADRLTEYRAHGESATARFNLTNSQGAAYVNSLVLQDAQFLSVRNDIRARCIDTENHLTMLSLRRMDMVSAAKHFGRSMRYRF